MVYKEIEIEAKGSSPDAKLSAYLLDTPTDHLSIQKRPVIILCPGGGYEFVSFREGEPLAMAFLGRGYHVCILHYSVAPARFPTALMELAIAVKTLREHAEEWAIDPDAILVQGSSAGGHLAASLGVFWNQEICTKEWKVNAKEIKPNGLILSYPVVSSREEAIHQGSFQNILGDRYEADMHSLSLEDFVNDCTPPCFIWHTNEDRSVPADNSLLFAMALRKHQVPVELHIFEKGIHGLGTASALSQRPDKEAVQKECECWIDMADAWIKNLCGFLKEI